MEKRPDQIASLNLTALIEEVKRADQLANEARGELEAAEELLKESRSKHRAAQEYQTILRSFAKALLSTRDPKAQERIRSKYQKKLADLQDLTSRAEKAKIEGEEEVKRNINNLMTLAEKALTEIATKVKGETNDAAKAACLN